MIDLKQAPIACWKMTFKLICCIQLYKSICIRYLVRLCFCSTRAWWVWQLRYEVDQTVTWSIYMSPLYANSWEEDVLLLKHSAWKVMNVLLCWNIQPSLSMGSFILALCEESFGRTEHKAAAPGTSSVTPTSRLPETQVSGSRSSSSVHFRMSISISLSSIASTHIHFYQERKERDWHFYALLPVSQLLELGFASF